MGIKSRLKKERRENRENVSLGSENKDKKPFLVNFIFFAACLVFLTPFFINRHFYFPFVGPKSLLFMAVCQITFFVWLFLIFKYKEYRPKLNSILIALTLFLVVMTLSSVFGVDPARSFWSKYERMTGLLMWFHLFAFFLVISSTFKKVSDWKKFFIVSATAAFIISLMTLLELAGVKSFKFADRGGSTLGNTSFLGTYLLFNVFLFLWFFFQTKKIGWKIFNLLAFFFVVLIIYFSEAKAAYISVFGALVFIFLLWLSFGQPKRQIRVLGKIVLVFSSFIVAIGLILLLIPGSPVNQKFIQLTGRARVVNWEIAQQGVAEKPILGWGPETYDMVFTKFFNPCFFLDKCGGEIWFDRSHNIVFDTLVTTGILGLLAYLVIFISFFFVFIKKYFREKLIDFWTFSIFPAVLIAYFIQNLTVFDMMASLMMFVFILAFGAFLSKMNNNKVYQIKYFSKNKSVGLALILFIIFCLTFFHFFIRPWRTDIHIIDSLKAKNSQERIIVYEKILNGSPLGDYQSIEFMAERVESIIKNNIQEIRENENLKKQYTAELNLLIKEVETLIVRSPLDFRNVLRLAHLYNIYSLLDYSKLVFAQEYGQRAIELSPTNQQAYWVLAQTKALLREFKESLSLCEKAIDLEPELLTSYTIGFQIAELSGDLEWAKKIADKAAEVNPEWEFNFQEVPLEQ